MERHQIYEAPRRSRTAEACGESARGREREFSEILLLSQRKEIIYILFSGGFWSFGST